MKSYVRVLAAREAGEQPGDFYSPLWEVDFESDLVKFRKQKNGSSESGGSWENSSTPDT